MDSTCTPSMTDWMQGIGNIFQAFVSLLTLVATFLIAWFAYKVSQGQIRPLLSLDIENGRLYTLIQLQNNGLGPATVTKVTYKLYGQQAREDVKEPLALKQGWTWTLKRFFRLSPRSLDDVVEARVQASVTQPAGSRVHLLQHKEVHEPGESDLTTEQLKEVLDPDGGNKQEGMVAGQVLKAGGEIVLLCAAVIEAPPGLDNGRAKAWLQLLRTMVDGAVIKVEYTDARGVKMPTFIGVITMPVTSGGATPAAAAAAAAAPADGADGGWRKWCRWGRWQRTGPSRPGSWQQQGSGSLPQAAGATCQQQLQLAGITHVHDASNAAEQMPPGTNAV